MQSQYSPPADIDDKASRIRSAYKRIGDIWSSEDEEFGVADAEELESGNVPEHVPFPIFMFGLAVLSDALDVAKNILPLFGWVLLLPLKLCIAIIFFIWFFSKLSGTMWKKILLRMIIMWALELTPLDFVPTQTVMVLMAHYRQTKIVRLMNNALEIMHKHKLTSITHA